MPKHHTHHDYRTPLSRVRGLGSAKDGTEHFWRQRLTAIANVPLMLFFVWSIVHLWGAGYVETVAYFSQPLVAIVFAVMIAVAALHMKLGMQVIIEDYVHGAAGKVLLIANIFFSIAVAVAALFAVLKLGFGA